MTDLPPMKAGSSEPPGTLGPTSYCPGCAHGIVERVLVGVLESMSLTRTGVVVLGAGCATHASRHLGIDLVQAAPGMAPAVATGLKRVRPDRLVVCYQGDADLAGRGLSNAIHAVLRGESITILCLNNLNAGYAGGRLSPATPPSMTIRGTGRGREHGARRRSLDLIAMLRAVEPEVRAERVLLDAPVRVKKAAAAMKRAFEHQMAGRMFSYLELVGVCPTGWGLTPLGAVRKLREMGLFRKHGG